MDARCPSNTEIISTLICLLHALPLCCLYAIGQRKWHCIDSLVSVAACLLTEGGYLNVNTLYK